MGGCKTLASFVTALAFPYRCAVCGEVLMEGEEGICISCNIDMPRTNYHLKKDNPVERMFWGKFPIERASAYFSIGKEVPITVFCIC